MRRRRLLRRMLVWCTMKALDCSGKSLKLTASLGSPRASSSASRACFSSFRLLQSHIEVCKLFRSICPSLLADP